MPIAPYCLFLLFLCSVTASAQKLVNVIDETIVVNSTTALSGYTRNITTVTLPDHTKNYLYRITITPKGHANQSLALFEILNNTPDIGVAAFSKVGEYAVKRNDNFAVDAFIFNNIYDADDFYAKKDGNWTYCKGMSNRTNCCFESDECINKRIFFGFRNNNIAQGLNVRLEVIAFIDDSVGEKFSYTITNSTLNEVKYFVSSDNANWEESLLRSGYHMIYNNSLKEFYFKAVSNKKTVAYKILPNERYKIVLDNQTGKLDLIRY